MCARKADYLLAHRLQLSDDIGIAAHRIVTDQTIRVVDGAPQGRRPATKGMHDLTQLIQGSDRRLPAMRDGDDADRAGVQVRTVIAPEVLGVVEGVLDHAADGSVVAGTGDEQAVGGAHSADEGQNLGGSVVGFGVVGGHHEIATGQEGDLGACIGRGLGGDAQGSLGGGERRGAAAECEDADRGCRVGHWVSLAPRSAGIVRPMSGPIRVIVAKPGLDGHDRGAKVVARALRDAGIEVIYTGLHQTPAQIVDAAIQEDADAVGLSVLSGAHITLFGEVMGLLRERQATDILVFGGGIIPEDDITELEGMGVARIFTPGTPTTEIVDWVKANVSAA